MENQRNKDKGEGKKVKDIEVTVFMRECRKQQQQNKKRKREEKTTVVKGKIASNEKCQ